MASAAEVASNCRGIRSLLPAGAQWQTSLPASRNVPETGMNSQS